MSFKIIDKETFGNAMIDPDTLQVKNDNGKLLTPNAKGQIMLKNFKRKEWSSGKLGVYVYHKPEVLAKKYIKD